MALLVKKTVKEPPRGGHEGQSVDVEPMPFGEALRHLFGQRSYMWLQAGGALHAVAAYGLEARPRRGHFEQIPVVNEP